MVFSPILQLDADIDVNAEPVVHNIDLDIELQMDKLHQLALEDGISSKEFVAARNQIIKNGSGHHFEGHARWFHLKLHTEAARLKNKWASYLAEWRQLVHGNLNSTFIRSVVPLDRPIPGFQGWGNNKWRMVRNAMRRILVEDAENDNNKQKRGYAKMVTRFN